MGSGAGLTLSRLRVAETLSAFRRVVTRCALRNAKPAGKERACIRLVLGSLLAAFQRKRLLAGGRRTLRGGNCSAGNRERRGRRVSPSHPTRLRVPAVRGQQWWPTAERECGCSPPTCWAPLSVEDVPPRHSGGRPLVLTCKACSEESRRHGIDAVAAHFAANSALFWASHGARRGYVGSPSPARFLGLRRQPRRPATQVGVRLADMGIDRATRRC